MQEVMYVVVIKERRQYAMVDDVRFGMGALVDYLIESFGLSDGEKVRNN
jgi:hypothetical protein